MEDIVNEVLSSDFITSKAIPKVIISLYGGSNNFEWGLSNEHMICEGIARAAHSSKAWIVCDSNMGITNCMRHTKTIFEDIVNIEFANKKDFQNMAVIDNPQPLHSHFVLYDDDDDLMCNKGIMLRTRFEQHMCQKHGASSCLIVANGGIDTVGMVVDALTRESPVVILEGTGGAADAMARAARIRKNLPYQHLDGILVPAPHKKTYEENMDKILKSNLVTFYSSGDNAPPLDYVILQVVLFSRNDTLLSKIELCMDWDNIDLMRSVLEAGDRYLNSIDLSAAIKKSLMEDKFEFFQLLMLLMSTRKMKFEIDLLGLYFDVKNGGSDKNIFLEKYKSLITTAKNNAMTDFKPADFIKSVFTAIDPLFIHYVCRLDNILYPNSTTCAVESTDLLFWAILHGKWEFAKCIASDTCFSVYDALQAKALCRSVAHYWENKDKQEFLRAAVWFERRATEMINSHNYEEAKKSLNFYPADAKYSTMELAIKTDCKDFVTCPNVQRYLDELLYYNTEKEPIQFKEKWLKISKSPISTLWIGVILQIIYLYISVYVVDQNSPHYLSTSEIFLWICTLVYCVEDVISQRKKSGVVYDILKFFALFFRLSYLMLEVSEEFFGYHTVLKMSILLFYYGAVTSCFVRFIDVLLIYQKSGVEYIMFEKKAHRVFKYSMVACFAESVINFDDYITEFEYYFTPLLYPVVYYAMSYLLTFKKVEGKVIKEQTEKEWQFLRYNSIMSHSRSNIFNCAFSVFKSTHSVNSTITNNDVNLPVKEESITTETIGEPNERASSVGSEDNHATPPLQTVVSNLSDHEMHAVAGEVVFRRSANQLNTEPELQSEQPPITQGRAAVISEIDAPSVKWIQYANHAVIATVDNVWSLHNICFCWKAAGSSSTVTTYKGIMVNENHTKIGLHIPHPSQPCRIDLWVMKGEHPSNKKTIEFRTKPSSPNVLKNNNNANNNNSKQHPELMLYTYGRLERFPNQRTFKFLVKNIELTIPEYLSDTRKVTPLQHCAFMGYTFSAAVLFSQVLVGNYQLHPTDDASVLLLLSVGSGITYTSVLFLAFYMVQKNMVAQDEFEKLLQYITDNELSPLDEFEMVNFFPFCPINMLKLLEVYWLNITKLDMMPSLYTSFSIDLDIAF